MAMLARPLYQKIVKHVGWGSGVAGAITVLLVVVVLAPLSVMTLSLVSEATTLIEQLRQSGGARQALQTLLTDASVAQGRLDPGQVQINAQQVLSFVQRHGGGALNAAGTIFGAATTAAIALVVFLYGFYTFLISSQRAKTWLLDHSPLERWETMRLADAYEETGRGLLIGVGLTAAFQCAVATVG
jgi:predicted PurR-regulated permease PerM